MICSSENCLVISVSFSENEHPCASFGVWFLVNGYYV